MKESELPMQAQPTKAPRRVRTKAPGVYRSVSGRYEIAYRDSDGRLVFKVVQGGFESAKAARADIVGKLSRGEPVRLTKATFGEFAETVHDGLTGRPATIAHHRWALDHHLLPRFRYRKLADISTDEVARLITEMANGVYFEKVDGHLIRKRRATGYAGWTTTGVISTLGLILTKAKRRGLIPANPVSDLERGERPKLTRAEKRVLDDGEIAKLLDNAGGFRPLIAVLIFSGLRLGEALGLQWHDIDDGFIHVRRQLGRDRKPAEIKTPAGRRGVVLMPQLASLLTAHKLASLRSQESDYVFAAPGGRGHDHRSAARGIERAVDRAKLGDGISAHSFRHTFASQLIGLGLDPVRVAGQLGHTSAAFTAATYAHEFERARHADDLRERMALGYGRLLDVNAMSTSARNSPQRSPEEVASIAGIRN
jgi:integrase